MSNVSIFKKLKNKLFCSRSTKDIPINDFFTIIIDSSPLGTLIFNSNFKPIRCNNILANIFGLKTSNDFLENFYQVFSDNKINGIYPIEQIKKDLVYALEVGRLQTQWIGLSLKGDIVKTDVYIIKFNYRDEEIVVVRFEDQVKLKELIRIQERTQLMFDKAPIAIKTYNKDLKVIDCNDAVIKMAAASNKEELLERVMELCPEFQPTGETVEQLIAHIKKGFEKGFHKYEWLYQTFKNEPIFCEVTLIKSSIDNQEVLLSYARDITQEKTTEDYIKLITENAPFAINILEKDKGVVYCNKVGLEMYGVETEQEYIDNFYNLSPKYQSDGNESINELDKMINKAYEKGYLRFEWLDRKVCGTPLPVEITLIRANFHSKDKILFLYIRDLTEEKHMLKELKIKEDYLIQAKEIAEQSTKVKSEFLANMSHEVRTPMNGIIGLLNILVGTKLDSMQQDYAQKALFSANELLRILNDILDLSKIEAGKLEMENVKFNVHDVCSDIQSLFGANARSKNLVFNLNEDKEGLVSVIGDPLRLKQVVSNLISNAIKFTQNGSVGLNISKDKQDGKHITYKFEIKDTGIGMSQENIQVLFNPFSQVDTSITRKFGGTGLGLSICKSIVELMNGKIWVESKPNVGSSFFFTATFEIAKLDENNGVLTEINNASFENTGNGKIILLVEDNHINQIVAKEILKKAGYSIDIADNGQIALDMIESKKYDAVLMDIQMPVMDGLTATTKIREQSKYKDLPIIAMSAHASNQDREKSIASGMNEHLTKPFIPKILYETLSTWIK